MSSNPQRKKAKQNTFQGPRADSNDADIQKQLDGLYELCSRFQMIVNEPKTKVMIFGNDKGTYNFSFNKKVLDIVTQYKYLGVIVNSVSNCRGDIFKNMFSYISDKARKCSFSVSKKCAVLGKLTPKVCLQFYDSFVSSVLNYGCEIWSKIHPVHCIECVHLRYLKYMLGVKDSTCSLAVYGETGRVPIF